jgi:hypothetical protein
MCHTQFKAQKKFEFFWFIFNFASLVKNNRLIFGKIIDLYLVFCISSYNGELEFSSFDVFFKNAAEQCLCNPSRKNSLEKAQWTIFQFANNFWRTPLTYCPCTCVIFFRVKMCKTAFFEKILFSSRHNLETTKFFHSNFP